MSLAKLLFSAFLLRLWIVRFRCFLWMWRVVATEYEGCDDAADPANSNDTSSDLVTGARRISSYSQR